MESPHRSQTGGIAGGFNGIFHGFPAVYHQRREYAADLPQPETGLLQHAALPEKSAAARGRSRLQFLAIKEAQLDTILILLGLLRSIILRCDIAIA